MDFNARAAWTTSPDPDTAKARRWGVWYVYVDGHDPVAASVITKIRNAGLYPGLFFAQNWAPTLSASEFADWASRLTNQLLPKTAGTEAAPAMLDLEVHDGVWLDNCIVRWREHQPQRPTTYTGEPYQGGFPPYKTMSRLDVHYSPQLYYGDMRPAEAAALQAVRDAESQGLRFADHVHPFYDGARIDVDSQRDGCYFTLERMPS